MRNAASSLDPRMGDVIVCPRIEGHRLSYVRLLVSRAVECGRSVEVLAPSGTGESPEYSLHLGAHSANVRLREMGAFTAPALQRVLEEQPRATFIFPDGDDVVRLLAMRKLRPAGTLVSVLSMRPRGQSQVYAKRFLETAAKALIRWIASLHRGVKVFSLVPSTAASLTALEVRDPIEFSPGESVPVWRLNDPSRLWFAIVGAITPRKNIDLVARALAQLDAGVGLVIAGFSEVDESVITEWTAPMRSVGQPVVRVARRLGDEELDAVIASADVAVIAHSNDGPSGIMGKADVAGRHVLAAGAPTLRRELRMNPGLGVWTQLTVPALARGAKRVLRMPARGDSGMAKESRDAFARTLRREDEGK